MKPLPPPPRPCVVISGISSALGMAVRRRAENLGFAVAGISRSAPPTQHQRNPHLPHTPNRVSDSSVPTFHYEGDICSFASCEDAVGRIVADHGPIYGVVACAGMTSSKLLISTPQAELEEILKVNVVGNLNLIKSCLKRGQMMRRSSLASQLPCGDSGHTSSSVVAAGGSVVCVGSSVGLDGNAGQVGYAASKAALDGAIKSLCKEYGRYNVRFNAIHPGLIAGTGMSSKLSEAQVRAFTDRCCLGRAATVDEVADGCCFLLTNSYVNGASLEFHGGKN